MAELNNDMTIDFETHPSRYKHIKLKIDGPVARLILDVQEEMPLRPGYVLKLNSYDLGVDIELADAVSRLRFEHPEVKCVVVSSAKEGIFCSGANIFMLGTSSHKFKVNFCKFTNETRLAIEDATDASDQTYIAALNGIASGGGYELALACKEIYLIDDRRSAVALPEVPYLGVLPGTGGLTRVVDKRKIQRDRADVFCTLAEGLKGKRAKAWGLIDDFFASSKFEESINARAKALAGNGHPERRGIVLDPLKPEKNERGIFYKHVKLHWGPQTRTAKLEILGPTELPEIPKDGSPLAASWYPLQMFRELDDALLQLRFNHSDIGLVLVTTRGDKKLALKLDEQLWQHREQWFVKEVLAHTKRVLKRMDLSAKSFFSLVDKDSCFVGTMYEFAMASDRIYMLASGGVDIQLSPLNFGILPMSNGLSRLASRLLSRPQLKEELHQQRQPINAAEADEKGLVTISIDELDWDDEIRLATEERISLSPDSLTGMEANLRFAGPETLETKIFGRLSAWQNWIFQRPNAVGEKGALKLYGQPETPQFDWNRT